MASPFDLTGKRALITGASSGIGRQIAISFAEAGAACVITGRDEGRLAETLGLMSPREHVTVVADLTLPEDRAKLIAAAGQVHGLVHAAGIPSLAPMRMVPEKTLQAITATNYIAPTMLTQGMLAKKLVAEGGAIVFITSLAAHLGAPANGAYSGAKAALVGMMRCMAFESARSRIRVNCIAPSYVESPMLDTMGMREAIEKKAAEHPLGMGTAQDVANTALYLVADSGRWMTGQSLILDGGFSMAR